MSVDPGTAGTQPLTPTVRGGAAREEGLGDERPLTALLPRRTAPSWTHRAQRPGAGFLFSRCLVSGRPGWPGHRRPGPAGRGGFPGRETLTRNPGLASTAITVPLGTGVLSTLAPRKPGERTSPPTPRLKVHRQRGFRREGIPGSDEGCPNVE